MTPDDWLSAARLDAERRALPELVPLLGAMHAAIVRLRAADWNANLSAMSEPGRPFGATAPGATEAPPSISGRP